MVRLGAVLIASVVLSGDTIYALLDGAVTLRFMLNTGLVAAVAGLVLAYYRDELHG